MARKKPASLADYLSETGQTQAQLAEAVGSTQGLISKYVRGEQTPRLDIAIRLHEVTGVPLEALKRKTEAA